jgi:hypothetical protein
VSVHESVSKLDWSLVGIEAIGTQCARSWQQVAGGCVVGGPASQGTTHEPASSGPVPLLLSRPPPSAELALCAVSSRAPQAATSMIVHNEESEHMPGFAVHVSRQRSMLEVRALRVVILGLADSIRIPAVAVVQRIGEMADEDYTMR